MAKLSQATACGIAFALGCGGVDGGPTGSGQCGSAGSSCVIASDCCGGFKCADGACAFQAGGGTGGTTGGSSGGGSGWDGGGSGWDGGGSSGGPTGSDGGSDDGGGAAGWGYIWVSTNDTAYDAEAFFDDGAQSNCVLQTIGPCQEIATDPTQCTGGTGGPGFPSTGPITIQGGSLQLVLQPAADGTYAEANAASPSWAPGDQLTFDSPGAVIPALDASVSAPTSLTFTQPTAVDGVTLLRSQDLAITWSGSSAGEVVVRLAPGAGTPGAPQLFCRFSPSAGSGTIPSAALSLLPAGFTGLNTWTESSATVESGSFQILLTAAHTQSLTGGCTLQ